MFVALGIKHAMRMRHIVPGLYYFSTLSHERHDFRKKKLFMEYNMFVSTYSITSSEMFFIIGRIERNMIKIYISLHVKRPLFLSDFNET